MRSILHKVLFSFKWRLGINLTSIPSVQGKPNQKKVQHCNLKLDSVISQNIFNILRALSLRSSWLIPLSITLSPETTETKSNITLTLRSQIWYSAPTSFSC
jgi:hypothetical protein